ncbi:MAG TPA: hypothetical protein VGF86_02125 [Candidatus Tumulicola sp.]|jgi:hypothetical protein
MIPRREREGRNDRITVARDVVEVVAIVAAGIWAFYIFAYENSFKPAHAPPSINVKTTIAKLGSHDGVIGVRIRTELRNSSTVPVRLLGFALTLYGQRVSRSAHELPPVVTATEERLRAFYDVSAPVPLYSFAHISKAVDPTSEYDSELGPGNSWDEEEIAYVPQHRFNLVTASVNVLYARDGATGLRVRLVTPKGRGPDFAYDHNDPRINQFAVDPLDSLDLDAR